MAEQARLALPADVMDKILELIPPPPPPGPKLIPCIRMRIEGDWLYINVSKAVSEEECRLICDGNKWSTNCVFWGFRVSTFMVYEIVTKALMLGYTFASTRDEAASMDGGCFTMYKK
jgi:hypothetical protein